MERYYFADEFPFNVKGKRYDPDDDLMRSNPVKRRSQHPYDYDPFTLWGGKTPNVKTTGVYTDRMQQWDSKKYDECMKKENEKGFFTWANGDRVQSFLRNYNNDQTLELTRVVEYCNQATGYPVWCLIYKYEPKESNATT